MAGISLGGLINNVTSIVPLWRFELELPTVAAAPGGLLTTPPSQVFAQKVSFNNQNLNVEDEEFAGWPKHFPTGSNVDTASITMLEDGGQNAWNGFKYWDNWIKLTHDRDGNFGLPIDYWKTITLYSLGVTGKRIAKFSIIEAWPTNVGSFDFDGESSMAAWNVITLSCSDVRISAA